MQSHRLKMIPAIAAPLHPRRGLRPLSTCGEAFDEGRAIWTAPQLGPKQGATALRNGHAATQQVP
jgi:hypothetical protein